MRWKPLHAFIVLVLSTASTQALADDDAARFGALNSVGTAELSPDGRRVVYAGPDKGIGSAVVVLDVARATSAVVGRADGEPFRFARCGWSALDRLVCKCTGLVKVRNQLISISRMFAFDADGNNLVRLSEKDGANQLYGRQHDGDVIDWLGADDGTILMTRKYVPEFSTGTYIGHTQEGLGVVRVDTRTLKASPVEPPDPLVATYLSDGHGNVRLLTRMSFDAKGRLDDVVIHQYRAENSRDWQTLGRENMVDNSGIQLEGIDAALNAAYVLKRLDGHDALFRIALDGSMKEELVAARPGVDFVGLASIGVGGRVIGAHFGAGDIEYFDPTYAHLEASLSHALPDLPIIRFISASADEQQLLVFAASDVDAGRFFVFDRTNKHLNRAMLARPALDGTTLSPVRAVSFEASDGTPIPTELLLPPGTTEAKGLPAIVLPRSGPSLRDGWGFDWLGQYFAHQGFVVLQPSVRSGSGRGEQWYVGNGFRDWKTSVGDLADAGRWLVAQGMADPERLAVVGWWYGGYVALHSNVVDPDLFKAVIAIAPITDLAALKEEARAFTNASIVSESVGSGPHVDEGSPLHHADRFKAPVLLFHGDLDLNVSVNQSKDMDSALRNAGKHSELVVYPKVDHTLPDSAARTDLLRRADAFLRANLKI